MRLRATIGAARIRSRWIRSTRIRSAWLGSAVCLAALGGVIASSPAPASAGSLQPGESFPSGEELLEGHVEAMGGRAALERHKSLAIRGRFESVAFENPLRLRLWKEAPDKQHLQLTDPGVLSIDLYFNGEFAWERGSRGTVVGPNERVTGDREKSFREDADFYGEASYAKRYSALTTRGIEVVRGLDLIRVDAAANDGYRPRSLFFSPDDGLLRAIKIVQPTQGELTVMFLEYTEVDGVKYPSRFEQRLADGSLAARFSYDSIRVTDPGSHDYSTPDDLVEPGAVGQGG
ncbi:MAG: hypothetical protein AAFR38_12260 [Planctomycetota bacterium]